MLILMDFCGIIAHSFLSPPPVRAVEGAHESLGFVLLVLGGWLVELCSWKSREPLTQRRAARAPRPARRPAVPSALGDSPGRAACWETPGTENERNALKYFSFISVLLNQSAYKAVFMTELTLHLKENTSKGVKGAHIRLN